MTVLEEDFLDADIPELAVEALSAASRRSLQAGHTLVYIQDGKLIKSGPSGVTVLKKMPGRQKVSTRIKNLAS